MDVATKPNVNRVKHISTGLTLEFPKPVVGRHVEPQASLTFRQRMVFPAELEKMPWTQGEGSAFRMGSCRRSFRAGLDLFVVVSPGPLGKSCWDTIDTKCVELSSPPT